MNLDSCSTQGLSRISASGPESTRILHAMDLTVCKIPVEGENGFLRLEIEWSCERFRVILFHNESVWTGKVTSEEIQSLSQLLSMDVKDYMSETRKALSSQGGAEEFTYSIENGRFLWKKLIDNDADLKIKFGSILLEEVPPFEMFECMLDAVIDVNHSLHTQVKTLEQASQQQETEKLELLRKLNQYQKEKVEMEETLYSNFLDILNAKKKRIRMLEKYIDNHHGTSKQGNTSSKHIVFESDSDTDDQEVNESDQKPTVSRLPTASEKSARTVIEDSDSDELPPKVVLRKKQQTKRINKINCTSIATSTKKETQHTSVGLSYPSSQHPSTSGHVAIPKVEEINHYDSDTDVDQCTDDESVKNLKVITRPLDACMDSLFDDIRKPAPTFTLPKRRRHQPVLDSSESTVSKSQNMSSADTKPSGKKPDQEGRRFNTQELLDELIN